jgi:uncharacterized membrane protein YkvA (DUF1232 family)
MMDAVWKRIAKKSDRDIIDHAKSQLDEALKASSAEYVKSRLTDIGVLVRMLDDKEWPIEDNERRRILVAVGYFGVPNDMIPDRIPGIGYLDDALIAELVIRELKPELDGYADFCKYRENETTLRGKKNVTRDDWLAAKRRQVWLRIRRQREERVYRGASGHTLGILRYQY